MDISFASYRTAATIIFFLHAVCNVDLEITITSIQLLHAGSIFNLRLLAVAVVVTRTPLPTTLCVKLCVMNELEVSNLKSSCCHQ